MASPHGVDPVNLGNPRETTVLELAEIIRRLANSKSEIIRAPLPKDDPDAAQARHHARSAAARHWAPRVSLEEGLSATIKDFQQRLGMASDRRVGRGAVQRVAGDRVDEAGEGDVGERNAHERPFEQAGVGDDQGGGRSMTASP